MKRALRWLLPVLILVEVGLVRSGLLDLGDALLALVGIEALIVLTGIAEVFLFARRYRSERASGQDVWATLEEGLSVLLSRRVARLLLQEPRILAALFRWTFRRQKRADNEFAYHKRSVLRAIVPLVVFTSPVELLVVHLLAYAFSPWGWVKWALLALGLYAIFWLLGLYASLVTLPHRLDDGGLRLRYGTLAHGFVPYTEIAKVERTRRSAPKDGDGLQVAPGGKEIYLPISGKTDLTLRLNTPQTVDGLFKTAVPATTIHLAADEPARLAAALRERIDGRTSDPQRVPDYEGTPAPNL